LKKEKKSITKVEKQIQPVQRREEGIKSRVMTCVVTGLERRVSKAGVAKGIKKFGNIFAFDEHYVSNEAKRMLKQRVSPEETQKQLRPSNKQPFSIDKQVLARLKLLKRPKNTKRITEEEAREIAVKWIPKEPRTYSSIKEYIIDNTKNGSCFAPQLYLNSDRVCDGCKYRKECLSTAKHFSKRYKD
jgi:hypothetical protein